MTREATPPPPNPNAPRTTSKTKDVRRIKTQPNPTELANRTLDNWRKSERHRCGCRSAGLLFSPRGVVRVTGHFSQTCRLTAENDEGPTA